MLTIVPVASILNVRIELGDPLTVPSPYHNGCPMASAPLNGVVCNESMYILLPSTNVAGSLVIGLCTSKIFGSGHGSN